MGKWQGGEWRVLHRLAADWIEGSQAQASFGLEEMKPVTDPICSQPSKQAGCRWGQRIEGFPSASSRLEEAVGKL